MERIVFITMLFLGILSMLTATEISTFNVYKSDFTVQRFALDMVDNIKLDELTNQLMIYSKDNSVCSIDVSVIDSMNYTSGNYFLPTVELKSCEFESDKNQIFCVVNTSGDGGDCIQDQGVCWSKSGTPTVNDNVFSSKHSSVQFYAMIKDLSLGETYHIRAYASNFLGVSYSDEVDVKTFTGNVTYSLAVDEEEYPKYHQLLKTALDSACYYYNMYTTFAANIYVYQSDDIPTTQVSYHGSIGFGPSESYMWVGTTMHEFAHFFGSGTTIAWKNLMVDGVWQGEEGQRICQELTKTELHGDDLHFWPGGINSRSEVSSEQRLSTHAKILQKMLVEDAGLPESW